MKILILVFLLQISCIRSHNEFRGCALVNKIDLKNVIRKAPIHLCTHIIYQDYREDDKNLHEVLNLKAKFPKLKIHVELHFYLEVDLNKAKGKLDRLKKIYSIDGVVIVIDFQQSNARRYVENLCSHVKKMSLECLLSTSQWKGYSLKTIKFKGLGLNSFVDAVIIESKMQSLFFKYIPKPRAVRKTMGEDYRSLEGDIEFWLKQGISKDKIIATIIIDPTIIYYKNGKDFDKKVGKWSYTIADVYSEGHEKTRYTNGTHHIIIIPEKLKKCIEGDMKIIVNKEEGYAYAEDKTRVITKSFPEVVTMQAAFMKKSGIRGFLMTNLNLEEVKDYQCTEESYPLLKAAFEGF